MVAGGRISKQEYVALCATSLESCSVFGIEKGRCMLVLMAPFTKASVSAWHAHAGDVRFAPLRQRRFLNNMADSRMQHRGRVKISGRRMPILPVQ